MKTILKNVQLIDLDSGSIQLNHLIINEQGIIEDILDDCPQDLITYQVIDGNNHYLLPGLINLHTHLFGSGNTLKTPSFPFLQGVFLRLLKTGFGKKLLLSQMKKNAYTELQSGVTVMRTVGEGLYQDIDLRQQINQQIANGPNLKVSGPMLSSKEGHGVPFVAIGNETVQDFQKSAQQNINHGVDWLKVCITGGVTDATTLGEAGQVQIGLEAAETICQEAHRHGIMVAAHAESTEGVRIALKAGVDSIEHGFRMDAEMIKLFKNNPKAYRGYSVLIPTFSPAIPFAQLSQKDLGVTDLVYQNGKAIFQGMLEGYKQAIENHITLGIGNDASMTLVTHYDFWRELRYCQQLGQLTTQEVLKIATLGNAQILGMDDSYGSIESGKIADLILLKDNPLQNLKALSSVSLVLKHGQLVTQKPIHKFPKVDQLLDNIAFL